MVGLRSVAGRLRKEVRRALSWEGYPILQWESPGQGAMSIPRFRAYMSALEAAQVQSFPIVRLLQGELTAPAQLSEQGFALICFQSAHRTVLEVCAEELGDASFCAMVPMAPSLLGQEDYLSFDQARVMVGLGLVAVLGESKPGEWNALPPGVLERELRARRQELCKLVGYEVQIVAMPNAKRHPHVSRAAYRAGFRAVLGSHPGFVPTQGPLPEVLPQLVIDAQIEPVELEQLLRGTGAGAKIMWAQKWSQTRLGNPR